MNDKQIQLRNEAIANMLGWSKAKTFVTNWTSITDNTTTELSHNFWIEPLAQGGYTYHLEGLKFHVSDQLINLAVNHLVDKLGVAVYNCLFPGGWEVVLKSSRDITRAVHYNHSGEKEFTMQTYLPSSSPREALFLAVSDYALQYVPTTIERILEQISVQEQITIYAGAFTAAIDSKCQDLGLEVWYDGDIVTIRRIK